LGNEVIGARLCKLGQGRLELSMFGEGLELLRLVNVGNSDQRGWHGLHNWTLKVMSLAACTGCSKSFATGGSTTRTTRPLPWLAVVIPTAAAAAVARDLANLVI
jgi:hypothetical protein